MTVAELIEELKKYDPEEPIILDVYRHTYHSVGHRTSHGPLVVHRHDGRKAFSDYNCPKGVVIRVSEPPRLFVCDLCGALPERDGWDTKLPASHRSRRDYYKYCYGGKLVEVLD